MQIQASIRHKRQMTDHNCASTCFAMLTGIDQVLAYAKCNTRKSGTFTSNVLAALKNAEIRATQVALPDVEFRQAFWLEALSRHFPLYLSCQYVGQYRGGARKTNEHAILCIDGMFYDPGEDHPVPVNSYESFFHKKLIIKEMIIVDVERPNYGSVFQKN